MEATGPAGLPLIAPMATWAGVTRSDEPGCEDDPEDHRGTVFRLLARDTEVALRTLRRYGLSRWIGPFRRQTPITEPMSLILVITPSE